MERFEKLKDKLTTETNRLLLTFRSYRGERLQDEPEPNVELAAAKNILRSVEFRLLLAQKIDDESHRTNLQEALKNALKATIQTEEKGKTAIANGDAAALQNIAFDYLKECGATQSMLHDTTHTAAVELAATELIGEQAILAQTSTIPTNRSPK